MFEFKFNIILQKKNILIRCDLFHAENLIIKDLGRMKSWIVDAEI